MRGGVVKGNVSLKVMILMTWAIVCWCFYQFCYPYHFYWQEETQLFLMSAEYLKGYFSKPAWVACMGGDFLTQFYYYTYAGASIITLLLLVTGDVSRRALEHAGQVRLAFPLAMAVMVILALTSLKYTFRLSSLLAWTGGIGMYYAWSLLRSCKRIPVPVYMVMNAIIAVLTFWMWGVGVWAFVSLSVMDSLTNARKLHAALKVGMFSLLVALLPLLRNYYFLDTDAMLTYPQKGGFCLPEWSLEKSLAYQTEYRIGNYQRVINMFNADDDKSELAKYFHNLVAAQRGTLADILLNTPGNNLGTFYHIGPKTPKLTIQNMHELYWAIGDMAFAERAAIMAKTFSPDNRNVRMIKRLAEINIVRNDTAAAMKYLRILDKTLVYGSFARKILNGDKHAMQPYVEKRKMQNTTSDIRYSDNAHQILVELMRSNGKNIVALDYLLCSDLLLKDIATFRKDYDNFAAGNPQVARRRLYQEAMCISLAAAKEEPDVFGKYVDYDVFTKFVEYNNKRGDRSFKGTYWYFYDRENAAKLETLSFFHLPSSSIFPFQSLTSSFLGFTSG